MCCGETPRRKSGRLSRRKRPSEWVRHWVCLKARETQTLRFSSPGGSHPRMARGGRRKLAAHRLSSRARKPERDSRRPASRLSLVAGRRRNMRPRGQRKFLPLGVSLRGSSKQKEYSGAGVTVYDLYPFDLKAFAKNERSATSSSLTAR